MSAIQPGDHVYIGDPAPRKVHWEVERVDSYGMCRLVSPMSGRRAGMYPQYLTLHSKGKQHGE